MNPEARAAEERRTRVQLYAELLVFDNSHHEVADLDLANPTREVIHAGSLFRQNDPLKRSVNVWKELWVVLFDHYLVMCKPKEAKYVVWKNPLRVEFLALDSLSNRPVQRSNTLSRMIRNSSPDLSALISQPQADPHSGNNGNSYYPLSFRCHGKHGGTYTLYAATLDERNAWRRALRGAIAARRAAQAEGSVFEAETITSDTAVSQDAPAHHPGLVTDSNDGRTLVAIGSEDGVWIGEFGNPQSLRRVMSLKHVTQLAFLAEQGYIVVLADKVLYAIDLESVVPTTGLQRFRKTLGLHSISGQDKGVQFFSVGRQQGKTLVIFKRKKGPESVFKAIEVLPAGAPTFGRTYMDFFLPCDAHDLLFLKSKICVLCPRGFELMSLADYSSATIPHEDDLRKVGRRTLSSKPLAMFRIRDDEFLLCFDDFGLYVNKHGTPSRSPPTLEWECVASHAAWHAPYVLLFSNSLIEVRHVESGRLAQVITGQDVHCLWDGRGVVQRQGIEEFDDPRTPRVHVVLDDSEMAVFSAATPHARMRTHSPPKRQHTVVLVPTERLVVPGTRYSPSLLSVAETLPAYVP